MRGVLLVAMLGGCYQPSTGSDIVEAGDQPPGGLFGADGGPNSSCTEPDPAPLVSLLHVRVRTTAFGRQYAPRNIGAIWIEDAGGRFIRTLERWGKTRARYLTRFNAASNGNLVDAVTGATLSQHTTHNREWDLTDNTTCEVPSGDYRIVVETTDYNGTGASAVFPFTKGEMPATITPVDTTNFHDLLIELR